MNKLLTKIDTYLITVSLYKVWFVTFLLVLVFWEWCLQCVIKTGIVNPTPIRFIVGTFGLPAFLALFPVVMLYFARTADKFYKKCKELEAEVKSATTKKELEQLHDVTLKNLRKEAFHHYMYDELHRIKAIIDTKYQYVP